MSYSRSARVSLGGATVLAAALCAVLGPVCLSADAAQAPAVRWAKTMGVLDTSVTIEFQVSAPEGEAPDVNVFYGKKDGGKEEEAWAHKTDKVSPGEDPREYSFTLEDLEPDADYVYRVRAANPANPADSSWSEAVMFRTAASAKPWYVVLLVAVVIVALFVVPFLLGGSLAKRFRMPDHGWKIGIALWSLACGLAVVYAGWPPSLGIDLSGGVILVYELEEPGEEGDEPQEGDEEDAQAGGTEGLDMDKLIRAVKLRVNPSGTKEVSIRKYGPNQIEIIIPRADLSEVKRIQDKVSSAGMLEFRILANNRDHKLEIEKAMESDAKEVWDSQGKEKLAWWLPVRVDREEAFAGYTEIATRRVHDEGNDVLEILVVNDPFNVNGGYLRRAEQSTDQQGQPCVLFTFNNRGGQLFAGLTGENLPDKVQEFYRKLGIVLDGQLYSAPRLQSVIHQRGEITGGFTKQETKDLIDVLNAGSLPASLKKNPISKLSTGPTLGKDTIQRGGYAITVSMILVLVFMLIYYRFAGIIACGALLTNLVLILAIMIVIGADFTLPGLAGLVLTVGMAVDANVLVFERIREELARDAALRMAIRNGFARATTTVIDANLTTLITATVLYWVGTDQIRGFAVILWLGVVLSMYTALFCSRIVFDIAERRRWITKLTMMRILGGTKIDFLGMRRIGGAVSVLLICVGLLGVYRRGTELLDIDFTGGVSVVTLFKGPQKIGDIRKKLRDLPGLAVSDVQLLEGEDANLRFVVNTSKQVDEEDRAKFGKDTTPADVVEAYLHEVFGDKLATNSLSVSELTAVAPGGPKPEKAAGSPSSLPRDVLAMAGLSPMLLAQAEPAGEQEKKPAEKAERAEKDDAEPEPPPEKTDQPTSKPSPGETRAVLTFTRKLNHDTVKDLLADALQKGGQKGVDIELSNENYKRGDSTSYSTWAVKAGLSKDNAEKAFNTIKDKLEQEPYFPASSSIGGKVAGKTQTQAAYALIFSLVCIVAYLWIRFQRVIFGLAAVIALVHDVLITLGALALSAYLANYLGVLMISEFKIGLSVLAAFLTIIGYSLNDTIVVFDRIREVRGKSPDITKEMINTSINQTLSRTLLTSLTTLLVVAVLYIGGGQGIHAFTFSLLVGIVIGTYSSIFVASPALYWMANLSRSKKAVQPASARSG